MHHTEFEESTDLQDRERLRAPDAIQTLITLFLFFSTLLLKLKYTSCSWDWQLWIELQFYGSLVWLTYLLITLVGKFKSRNLRYYMKYLDYFWFLFHIGMWIWLVVIMWRDQYLEKCSEPVDMFGVVYLILGGLAGVIVIFGLLGGLFGLVRPKDSINTDIGRGVYHDPAYDDNLDFNPYN